MSSIPIFTDGKSYVRKGEYEALRKLGQLILMNGTTQEISGVSKSRLTDNIEKRIIIIRGGISHTNACVGGVGNGSDERLCCPSG